jgi:phage repressor protein C with HTH and peptisase S24 domain
MPAMSAPGGMATRQAGHDETLEAPSHQPPAPTDPAPDRLGWLPVLGRSAAGVAQFWIDKAQAEGITQLADLVARQGRQEHLHRATASQSDSPAGDSPVWLVTLRAPDESDVVEFVAAPQLKARYADAFALRIDGESMAPDIRHGDLVVLSPSAPAVDGRAAVVQLDGQIGVTCKLYRRAGRDVHLLPVNEHFPSQTFPASQVLWAFRVLARVRM